jgi:hypothetical protein
MAARKKNVSKDAAAGSPAASSAPGDDGAEVAEERVEVVMYAAAVDVAKGSGMVCTRVPGSRPDRKRQKVWCVEAAYGSVAALMDHLRCEGIQRLVVESTGVTGGSGTTWLRRQAWRCGWSTPATSGTCPARGKSDREDCVWLCKLNERGMLRRSFVPPEAVRDLRSLTRTRSRLAQDQVRHQNRVEKILEDAAEDLGGDLGPVRDERAAVPGRPGRRGTQPGGAGRAGRLSAEGHAAAAG